MAEVTVTLKDLGPVMVHVDFKFDPVPGDGIPDDQLTGSQKLAMLLVETLNMSRRSLIADLAVIDTKHS